MKPSENVLAYLFTPIVCLSKVSNSRILLCLKQSWHSSVITSHHFHFVFLRNAWLGTDIFIKVEYIARSLVKIKSIPDWHLFISRMEKKWTKWYAMTSHVIAYRSLELLFGTHTFHFNCFFDDFYCVFTQIRCLSRVLSTFSKNSFGNTFRVSNILSGLIWVQTVCKSYQQMTIVDKEVLRKVPFEHTA